MNDLIIGVLGGMGPDATIQFYHNLTKRTEAVKDQDHYHIIIDSNAKIPDRTGHILRGTDSPLPEMIKSAKMLQNAGAKVLVMPCMTAHFFAKEIQEAVDIPLIQAPRETATYIRDKYPLIKKIGILCTTGTKSMKIFDRHFDDFEIFYPRDDIQENQVMAAIYGQGGIKAGITSGRPKKSLINAGEHLIARGVDLIIGGCTEIPLAVGGEDFDVPFVNPMTVLIETLLSMQ